MVHLARSETPFSSSSSSPLAARTMPKSQKKPKVIGKIPCEFYIPWDEESWLQLSKDAGLSKKTIHDLTEMRSGSEITEEQFVLLRVLWPRRQSSHDFDKDKGLYGLDQVWQEARTIIDTSREFSQYLQIVRNQTKVQSLHENDPRRPGSFKPVRRFQEQILDIQYEPSQQPEAAQAAQAVPPRRSRRKRVAKHTAGTISRTLGRISKGNHRELSDVEMEEGPSETGQEAPGSSVGSLKSSSDSSLQPTADRDSYPNGEDESIVNTSMILLLDALGGLVFGSRSEWVLNHIHFKAEFSAAHYNTYTDGALWASESHNIQAIVEVKRKLRYSQVKAVQTQESAEMVGWILKGSEENIPDLKQKVRSEFPISLFFWLHG